MVECEISFVVQDPSVIQRRAVVELVEGHDIVGIGISQGQMSYKPAGAVVVRIYRCHLGVFFTYMKPAPPVIMIFFTSGNGSYFVVPISTGASFHTPKSSKKRFGPVEAAVPICEKLHRHGGRTQDLPVDDPFVPFVAAIMVN